MGEREKEVRSVRDETAKPGAGLVVKSKTTTKENDT